MKSILILSGLLVVADFGYGGVINGPSSPTQPWKTKNIPYKWMGTDSREYDMISQAMAQISQDSGYCVNFTDISRNTIPASPFISIQPKFTNSPTNVCWTYHGYYAAQGNEGQVLVAFNSDNGNSAGSCLDNKRDAMHIIMNVLGVRNEFMKSYRSPNYMVFSTSVDRNSLVAPSLQSLNIFADANMYTDPSQAVDSTPGLFDTNSVTMVTPQKYAGTSTPVFSMFNNMPIGQLARLSWGDCLTLSMLYECNRQLCTDPYSNAAIISLSPNPAVLMRSVQCHTTAGGITLSDPLPVGQFLINGLQYSTTNPPSLGPLISSIPGLQVELKALAFPVVPAAATNEASDCLGGNSCVYSLKFSLNRPISKGMMNQQVSVNVIQAGATIANLEAIININCAPIFQTLTAMVGITPALVSQLTYRLDAEITAVSPPSKRTLSPVLQSSDANGAGFIAQYIINYNIPNGVGDTGNPATAPTPPATAPRKVYVNCVPAFQKAGTTIIGTVTATDPEGGSISYYAYSGLITLANNNYYGEFHSVTREGVIGISALARITGVANPADPSPVGDQKGGTSAAALPDQTGTLPTDVFIVAVDAHGGSSILQARFYLACGEVVT